MGQVHHPLHSRRSPGAPLARLAHRRRRALGPPVCEFVRKAAHFLRSLDTATRGDGSNAISLVLPNGSRIVGLPGKEDTIRGFSSVALLLRSTHDRGQSQLHHLASLHPQTAGKVFYEEWTAGGDTWTRIQVPATECPRISAAALDDERRRLPDDFFNQEYMCEFTRAEDSYFSPESIDDAFRRRRDESNPIMDDQT